MEGPFTSDDEAFRLTFERNEIPNDAVHHRDHAYGWPGSISEKSGRAVAPTVRALLFGAVPSITATGPGTTKR